MVYRAQANNKVQAPRYEERSTHLPFARRASPHCHVGVRLRGADIGAGYCLCIGGRGARNNEKNGGWGESITRGWQRNHSSR